LPFLLKHPDSVVNTVWTLRNIPTNDLLFDTGVKMLKDAVLDVLKVEKLDPNVINMSSLSDHSVNRVYVTGEFLGDIQVQFVWTIIHQGNQTDIKFVTDAVIDLKSQTDHERVFAHRISPIPSIENYSLSDIGVLSEDLGVVHALVTMKVGEYETDPKNGVRFTFKIKK